MGHGFYSSFAPFVRLEIYFANLPVVDAFLNASTILTGMGPVDKMETTN